MRIGFANCCKTPFLNQDVTTKKLQPCQMIRLSAQTPHRIALRLFLVLLSQDCPNPSKHVGEEKQRDLMMCIELLIYLSKNGWILHSWCTMLCKNLADLALQLRAADHRSVQWLLVVATIGPTATSWKCQHCKENKLKAKHQDAQHVRTLESFSRCYNTHASKDSCCCGSGPILMSLEAAKP